MTGEALHWRCVIIDLVTKQAEPRFRVIEQGKCRLCRVEIFSLVIGMASKTTPDVSYQAVRPILAMDLPGHAAVALQAQGVLRGFERLVTTAAIRLDFGV